jgi:para-nitrobenzyl esterase
MVGNEDCLYLNVWAPANARNLPVMLWIHGGGNTIGQGGTYNGAHLAAAENVVVITINYRLGPFGWFSHPDLARGNPLDDSGNYGTLDVVRALEWTRDNVSAFGGNPDNVTVFGESAGATDTLAMMASPLAAGLFDRAIVQSGGFMVTDMAAAQNFLPDGGHTMSSRELVANLLVADGTVDSLDAARDYETDMGPARLREYLYGKSAEEIFALFEQTPFGMINVPDNFGDGYVLPDMTTEAIFSSPDNYNVVPVILGTNRDEPALFMFRNPENLDRFLWIFPRLADEDAYLRAVRYGAESWKYRGVDSLARYMRASGNPDVYGYRFDWDEEGSVLGFDLSKALGAAHGLEIAFVFGDFEGGLGAGYLYDASEGREALSESMMAYWGEFARTGDPGRGTDGAQVQWLPWGEDDKTYIVLDTPEDQGIHMVEDQVTLAGLKEALATDTSITDPEERCRLYVRNFGWPKIDRAEYDSFGPDGCAQFDPEQFRMF